MAGMEDFAMTPEEKAREWLVQYATTLGENPDNIIDEDITTLVAYATSVREECHQETLNLCNEWLKAWRYLKERCGALEMFRNALVREHEKAEAIRKGK
jgi:hypothetical protein